MIMVGPTQVEKFLEKNDTKYFWYQMEVNLRDDMIVGPFEFEREPMWTIPNQAWETLIARATEMEIEPQNMNCNRIDPIATAQKRKGTQQSRQDKRRK
jgi:hypothetical protein